MKKVIYALFTAAVALTIVSCASNNKLQKLVEEANRICPFDIGGSVTMDMVSYADETVTFYYTVSKSVMDVEKIRENEEDYRQNMLVNYTNSNDRNLKLLLDAIIEADADLEVVYSNPGEESFRSRFSANELKDSTPAKKDPVALLESNLNATKAQLPMSIANGMALTDVLIENGYWVYVYECDESIYDIEMYNSNYGVLRLALKEELSKPDPLVQTLVKQLKDADTGLIYRYIGATSKKACSVVFECSEL